MPGRAEPNSSEPNQLDPDPSGTGQAELAEGDTSASPRLLGPAEIRALAARLGIRPTKTLGQNFLHDANTIRRIVAAARVRPDDAVLEIGPGLGSLTLGLLGSAASVQAVEIDPVLAAALPATVADRAPAQVAALHVIESDALVLRSLPHKPTTLVANLPYNVAVPVLLTMLERFGSLRSALVLVQAQVADRLCADPGSKVYGVPSVKTAWYGVAERAGNIGPSVFWPVPNVDSGLVRIVRTPAPVLPDGVTREDVFALIDKAFSQRRKMLRAILGNPEALMRAGVAETARGETLGISDFVRLASELAR